MLTGKNGWASAAKAASDRLLDPINRIGRDFVSKEKGNGRGSARSGLVMRSADHMDGLASSSASLGAAFAAISAPSSPK